MYLNDYFLQSKYFWYKKNSGFFFSVCQIYINLYCICLESDMCHVCVQYLELRFNRMTRLMGTGLFIVQTVSETQIHTRTVITVAEVCGRGSTNAQVLTSVVKDPLHRHRHLRSSPGFEPRWVGHSPQESEQHRTRTRGHLNLQPLLCFVKWPPLTACSFCSNRYGPVGGSHFHWCGVYLLLYNGRWLRQFKSF